MQSHGPSLVRSQSVFQGPKNRNLQEMRNPAPLPPPSPWRRQPLQDSTRLLEINLISAQNLKSPATNIGRLRTYAVAYVDPTMKLRTRVDRIGAENPTWNDRFIFRVTDDFISSDTSAVMVDIFAVGMLKDTLLGSVRFLISNVLEGSSADRVVPAFAAVHIRRPSGRFYGVLNLGVMLINTSAVNSSLCAVSAIGYADMMGEERRNHHRRRNHSRGLSDFTSCNNSWGSDSMDFSDSTESTVSNSSGASPGSELRMSDRREKMAVGESEGMNLCGLGRKRSVRYSPSHENIKAFGEFEARLG